MVVLLCKCWVSLVLLTERSTGYKEQQGKKNDFFHNCILNARVGVAW